MELNIKQVFTVNWKGKEGDLMTDIVALADDNLLYRWHKPTAKWTLYIIN